MTDARCSAEGCWYTLPVTDGLIVAHSKAGTLDVCEGGGRPPLEPQLLPLACVYCGGKLTVDLETKGSGHLTFEVPESISCDEIACGAEWLPDGTPRELPAYVRHPTLYSRPTVTL